MDSATCICVKVQSENPTRPGDDFTGTRTLLMWNCPTHGWRCAHQPRRGPIEDEWDAAEARHFGWTKEEQAILDPIAFNEALSAIDDRHAANKAFELQREEDELDNRDEI